jgi:ribosomal protein L11 methylase PrmA
MGISMTKKELASIAGYSYRQLYNIDRDLPDNGKLFVEGEGGKYDLICANIVADIIIRMNPDVAKYLKDDGVILASGIITERADDVIASFEANGFKIVEKVEDNGWCALAVKKNI